MAKRKNKNDRTWTSPIELMMRNALCQHAKHAIGTDVSLFDYSTSKAAARALIKGEVVAGVEDPDGGWNVAEEYEGPWGDGDDYWSLYASVWISSYRIDLMMCGPNALIALECDGHDFHNLTKQQASADRARDRELLRLGVPTIRFTGSDIFNRAAECARDAFSLATELSRRAQGMEQGWWSSGFDAGVAYGEKAAHARIANRGVFAGTLSEIG